MSELLDSVRCQIRLRHYSILTEHSYVDWVYRYILYNNKRHPAEMGAPEITSFLSHLATDLNVAASTQNQRVKGFASRAYKKEASHVLHIRSLL